MPPSLLHQFWALIEETQTTVLLSLDDAALVQCLTKQFQRQNILDAEESQNLNDYVSSRLPLIRELAQSRRPVYS